MQGELTQPRPYAGDTSAFAHSLMALQCAREVLIEAWGSPHQSTSTCDCWAWQYPCGLKLTVEFPHAADGQGVVSADLPEIEHVLRHLPVPRSDCRILSSPAEEFESLRRFQVCRQGDDGNPFTIGQPTSERDAQCLVAQFESHGHKQLYWYDCA